ncbi:hypothetical protein SAMN05421676_11535 [Salinibacillus kushneri]|uniref:Uncharacterized protein n=1 Tax=Salinibacillus kushneri TaxID=237682 RepID=A0A1I0J0J8_9BACI|nr:hypothetical protein SAMN05421676_11535 [Salinibacillus kushneri]
MLWIFWFFIGFGLTIAGGVSLIIYLNIIPVGLSFIDYLLFIVDKPETYLLPVGILIISFTCFFYPSD